MFRRFIKKYLDPNEPAAEDDGMDISCSEDASHHGDASVVSEDGALFRDSSDGPDTLFNSSTATLSQLLTRIVPDANIHCPNVVVVGAQSSGKTKMIISMVFHHLIENPSVTDEMGEKLLKIFRTGEKMVTRRPTKIQFVKAECGSPCTITLAIGKHSAMHDDPLFDEIIEDLLTESKTLDGRAFADKVTVTIAAPDLPSMTFTDLPGLITEDRLVSDRDDLTMRKLVTSYMCQKDTTLLVVERASNDDFETSQIIPLLRTVMETGRRDIFENSVLVLSKCDQVRSGAKVMRYINMDSAEMEAYPFRHVVGVVNANDADTPATSSEANEFARFKQYYTAVKDYERKVFENFLNNDKSSCNVDTQCTTAAVFHQMDQITFSLVHQSIGRGLESIGEKVEVLTNKMQRDLAPPLSFYDATPCSEGVVCKNKRLEMLDAVRSALKHLLTVRFRQVVFDSQPRSTFLDRIGVHWPVDHTYDDMTIVDRQNEALDGVRTFFLDFLQTVRLEVEYVCTDHNGCMSRPYSSFHRIDRFSQLTEGLADVVRTALPSCVHRAEEAVSVYLKNFQQFEVPRGVRQERFWQLLKELKRVALEHIYVSVQEVFSGECAKALFFQDALFVESPDFVAARTSLHARWDHLRRQKNILHQCSAVTSNRDLYAMLQNMIASHDEVPDQNNWHEFWRTAEEEHGLHGEDFKTENPDTCGSVGLKRKSRYQADELDILIKEYARCEQTGEQPDFHSLEQTLGRNHHNVQKVWKKRFGSLSGSTATSSASAQRSNTTMVVAGQAPSGKADDTSDLPATLSAQASGARIDARPMADLVTNQGPRASSPLTSPLRPAQQSPYVVQRTQIVISDGHLHVAQRSFKEIQVDSDDDDARDHSPETVGSATPDLAASSKYFQFAETVELE